MKYALTEADMTGLKDDQKTAIFEALVTAVLADGKIDQEEIERFEKEIAVVPWGKDEAALSSMVTAARARVGALKGQQDVVAFIDSIAAKLPAQELREKVWRMMADIIFSNREINQNEKNVLGAFALAFKLSKEQIEAIRVQVMGK
jgi:uncharacterized tellurite resistance protein B-like protein